MFRAFAISTICSFIMTTPSFADDTATALICATKLGSDLTARSHRAVTMVTINECRLTYLKRSLGDCAHPDALESQSVEIDLSAVSRVSAHYNEDGTEFVLSGKPDIRELVSDTVEQCDGDILQRSSLSEAVFTVPTLVPISRIETLRVYVKEYCL